MTRAVSVGRSSKGLLFIIGALGSVLVTMTFTGCPGTLDGNFPSPPGGGAGSSGSAGAGTAGMAMGTAGSTGTGGLPAGCDPVNLLTNKYNCLIAGACHDAAGSAANFSMAQANWPKLVGMVPKGGGMGSLASICAADPNFKTVPYIIKGSSTGDGLIMKKLVGPAPICEPGGGQMPTIPGPITVTADMTCIRAWATQLANAN